MTRISIWDCGCGVEVEVTRGALRVINSGGTPAAEILGRVRVFADPEKTVKSVMRKWLRGYEGGLSAAQENQLYVEIDGYREYA